MPKNSIRKSKNNPCLVQFFAVINGKYYSFATRSQLDEFIVKYSSVNSIYECSLFKVKFYNLLENA